MSILFKHLPLVKGQMEFHDKMTEKYGESSFRATLHKTTAERLAALYADLEVADAALDAPKPEATPVTTPIEPKERQPFRLFLSAEEIDDLPQELIEQLAGADKTEFAIVNVMEDAKGIITLDRLLIGLYRKTQEIFKRDPLTTKLYRMAQKNLIFNVPGKKGVYSLEQLTAEEADALFGTLKQKS